MIKSILKPLYVFYRRIFRRVYWRTGRFNEQIIFEDYANTPEATFWPRVDQMLQDSFSLIEMGCQNGRALLKLSEKHTNGLFFGIDLNSNAVESGHKYVNMHGIKNVKLTVGNVMEIVNDKRLSLDYFCSCAALIYLDTSEIRTLLLYLMESNVKGIYFCEPSSLSSEELKTHIFIHSYEDLLSRLGYDNKYSITVEKFSYSPWEGKGYAPKMFFLNKKS